jgi:hypothetical protein
VAEVQARAAGHVTASTRSNRDGSYRLTLPSGTYTLDAVSTGTFPTCPSRTATVSAPATTTADISCDTGIR